MNPARHARHVPARTGRAPLVMAAVLALTLAALLIPGVARATDNPGPDTATVTVAWVMPTPAGGWTSDPDASTATWPQTLDTGACGSSWLQVDVWRGRQSVIDAILADGHLTRGEDWSVVISWRFVAQAPCLVSDPEPGPDPAPESTATPDPRPTPTVPPEPYDEGDDIPAPPATPAVTTARYTG